VERERNNSAPRGRVTESSSRPRGKASEPKARRSERNAIAQPGHPGHAAGHAADHDADRAVLRPRAGASRRAGARTDPRSETRSELRGPAPLDSALKTFLRASGIGEKLGPWAMFQAFGDAAGPAFARHARAVRFARGELLVEVDSAPHLSELKGFRGEEIRARTNQILGRDEVRRITFRLKR
jgi:hypothetical protein